MNNVEFMRGCGLFSMWHSLCVCVCVCVAGWWGGRNRVTYSEVGEEGELWDSVGQ